MRSARSRVRAAALRGMQGESRGGLLVQGSRGDALRDPRRGTTAANLIEHVLPRVALRQWVLTFPFRWRRRLAQDGELLGELSRLFVSTVQAFYGGKTGAMTVVQRTSSDLRLNPHLHVVFLDGAY